MYWHHVEIDPRRKLPLLLFLTGSGESGGDPVAQTAKHGPWMSPANAAAAGDALARFVRVGPHLPHVDGRVPPWNPAALAELVRDLRARHGDIAPDLLVVVGISHGGSGALEFVARHGRELGVGGVVACCPARVDWLARALEVAPIYVFHAPGDDAVPLDAARERVYRDHAAHPGFRYREVHPDWTHGGRHVCWPEVLRDPVLYDWLEATIRDGTYRSRAGEWPAFEYLGQPRT